jgi:hypothetical protein
VVLWNTEVFVNHDVVLWNLEVVGDHGVVSWSIIPVPNVVLCNVSYNHGPTQGVQDITQDDKAELQSS